MGLSQPARDLRPALPLTDNSHQGRHGIASELPSLVISSDINEMRDSDLEVYSLLADLDFLQFLGRMRCLRRRRVVATYKVNSSGRHGSSLSERAVSGAIHERGFPNTGIAEEQNFEAIVVAVEEEDQLPLDGTRNRLRNSSP